MFAVSSLEPRGRAAQRGRRARAAREQRIPVAAAATGGNRGRTIRVDVSTGTVTVREAGGKDTELLAGIASMEVAA